MWWRIEAVSLFLVLSWCAATRADLIPSNVRDVHNDQFIDNLADYPDYVFFVANDRKIDDFLASPQRQLASWQPSLTPWYLLNPGDEVRYTHFSRQQASAHLYAVPRRLAQQPTAPKASWFSEPPPGILKSDVPFMATGEWVPTTDRTAKIITHYRIELTDSALRLWIVSSERLDASGRSVPVMAQVFAGAFAALAVAAIGVLYLRWRRTRSAEAKPLPDAITSNGS